MRKIRSRAVRGINIIVALGLLVWGLFSIIAAPAAHAACAAPPKDYGTLTYNTAPPSALSPLPGSAKYTIWTRVMVPDATNNSINLEIDGSTCLSIGGGDITPNVWTWVKHVDGDKNKAASLDLSAGNHTFKYIATKPNFKMGGMYLTSDASCVPKLASNLKSADADCSNGDSTPPTVNLNLPANGQTVSGTVALKATASDASGVREVQFLLDGKTLASDKTNPYAYDWDSLGSTNGTHKLTAKAFDVNGNEATSSTVTVTVTGGMQAARGDVSGDGLVNATDITLVTNNFNKTNPNPVRTDINNDGIVNAADLSIVVDAFTKATLEGAKQ